MGTRRLLHRVGCFWHPTDESLLDHVIVRLRFYRSFVISLKSDETRWPRTVRTAIETTAIRKSRSAYSTIACPSSRSRAEASARYARVGSERSMSTILLLLGLAVESASALSWQSPRSARFQPPVPPLAW